MTGNGITVARGAKNSRSQASSFSGPGPLLTALFSNLEPKHGHRETQTTSSLKT